MKFPKRLVLFLVVAILGISFTFYAFQILYTPNFLINSKNKVLLIEEGDNFKDVQKKLKEGEFVNDLVSFSFLAKISNVDDRMVPGRYLISRGMTNLQVLKILKSGRQGEVQITFNNVRLIQDLAEKITKNLVITPEEFKAALVEFTLENNSGFTKDNILCMFIPNTYEVYGNIDPDDLIARMQKEYNDFWTPQRREKAESLGLTPIEVSILASIVQAESIQPDEAPIIAGLYLNRLEKGIALQADPTLVFAAGDFTLKRVLNEHKRIDSPYNTYLYPGLPPGPINMPEIQSIDAVLNHTKSDYYYMCAKEDFSGRHNFSNSYEEHMKNAYRYQQALTREQKKAKLNR